MPHHPPHLLRLAQLPIGVRQCPGTSRRLSQTAGPAESGRKRDSLHGCWTQDASQKDVQDLGNLMIQEYKVNQLLPINHTYEYAYTMVRKRGEELKSWGFHGGKSLKTATVYSFLSSSTHSSTHHWVGSRLSFGLSWLLICFDQQNVAEVMLCWFWV